MKKIRIIIIMLVVLITLSLILNAVLPRKITVLGYHDIALESTGQFTISKDKFEKQMKFLKYSGYDTLTMEDIKCYFDHTCKLKRRSVLITFDDGFKSNLEIALPLLKKYNMNATIFYIGKNADEENSTYLNREDLERIEKEYPNITIASHSYDFHHEGDYLKTYEEIDNDIKKMKSIIDAPYFAYPYGHYNETYIKALKDNDYELAFTFGPDKEHRKANENDNKYEIPRLNISADMPLWKFVGRLIIDF